MSSAARIVGYACAFLGVGAGVWLLFADGDLFGLLALVFGLLVFAIAWSAE